MPRPATHTVTHGWPSHTIRLSATLFRYLDAGGHYTDALTIQSHARDAAHTIGDKTGGAMHSPTSASPTGWWAGSRRPPSNSGRHWTCSRRSPTRPAERARSALSAMSSRGRANHRAAADHIRQAMVLYRRIGDTIGEARNLGGLAIVEARLGHHEAAARGHERTLL
jgi:hypothetical protein